MHRGTLSAKLNITRKVQTFNHHGSCPCQFVYQSLNYSETWRLVLRVGCVPSPLGEYSFIFWSLSVCFCYSTRPKRLQRLWMLARLISAGNMQRALSATTQPRLAVNDLVAMWSRWLERHYSQLGKKYSIYRRNKLRISKSQCRLITVLI